MGFLKDLHERPGDGNPAACLGLHVCAACFEDQALKDVIEGGASANSCVNVGNDEPRRGPAVAAARGRSASRAAQLLPAIYSVRSVAQQRCCPVARDKRNLIAKARTAFSAKGALAPGTKRRVRCRGCRGLFFGKNHCQGDCLLSPP
jgi:hypothetical protein